MFRYNSISRWFCFLVGFLSLAARQSPGQSKEYQVKAAFLLNFAQFVEWPAGAFSGPDAPLNIGVLGDDPFGAALEETVQNETIHGHKLVVRRAHKPEELEDCQMVFISKSEDGRTPEILKKMDTRPIMTVGEMTGFARHGGTINFYRQQNKLRFEINPDSAKRKGLKISSQLLALGKIVETNANP